MDSETAHNFTKTLFMKRKWALPVWLLFCMPFHVCSVPVFLMYTTLGFEESLYSVSQQKLLQVVHQKDPTRDL